MHQDETYELFQRGRAHLQRGDNAQATVSLEKAKRREPDKASIREALGLAYLRLHRYREAAAEFEYILDTAPANDYAHYCMGRCLSRMGEEGLAAGHYKMALWLRPEVDYYREAVDKLTRLVAEPDRDRAVVHERDPHVRAEPPGLHLQPGQPQLVGHRVHQHAPLVGRRGAR